MATLYSKQILSASANGKPILPSTASTPGTLIHKSITETTSFDEIWIYAQCLDTIPRKLTIEWGQTLSTESQIILTPDAQAGLVLVVPGILLNGGLEVRAFTASPGSVSLFGYVNRIS
jgi:hypothetical protein